MEIVGQGACEGADQIVTPILPELDIENVDFKHVTRFGALDRHRTGQDMTRHHPLAFGMHLAEFGRDVKPGFIGHHFRATADGVDGDVVAAFDGEHRLQLGFEKAPMAGLGA